MAEFSWLANEPGSYDTMEMRKKIALAMMAKDAKKGYPKNIGEGLTSIGDALGEIGMMRWAERTQAQQDAARLAGQNVAPVLPGGQPGSGPQAPPPRDVAPPQDTSSVKPPEKPAVVTTNDPPVVTTADVPAKPAVADDNEPLTPDANDVTANPPFVPPVASIPAPLVNTPTAQQPPSTLFNPSPMARQGGGMVNTPWPPASQGGPPAPAPGPRGPMPPIGTMGPNVTGSRSNLTGPLWEGTRSDVGRPPSLGPRSDAGPMQGVPVMAQDDEADDPMQPRSVSTERITPQTQTTGPGFPGAQKVVIGSGPEIAPDDYNVDPGAAGDPWNARSAAIAGIETGGEKSPYTATTTTSAGTAYGKYQVMGNEIPGLTQKHFDQALTPQQFLANKEAQEAVFRGEFGNAVDKYGDEGAARFWFGGAGGVNHPGATDPLGRLNVGQYGRDYLQRAGITPEAAPTSAVSGRDRIAAQLMQQQAQEGRLGEVAGMQRGPTGATSQPPVMARTGDVGPEVKPVTGGPGERIGGSVLDTVQQRNEMLRPGPEPTVQEVPQGPPTRGMSPTSQTTTPPSTLAAISATSPSEAAGNRPIVSDIRAAPAPGAQLAQANIPPGQQDLPPQDQRVYARPTPPVPPQRTPMGPEQLKYLDLMRREQDPRMQQFYKQGYDAWENNRSYIDSQNQKKYESDLASHNSRLATWEANERARLEAAATLQSQREKLIYPQGTAAQPTGPAAPVPQGPPGSPVITDPKQLLGTPRSPQRTGVPNPPPKPPGIPASEWAPLQAKQAAQDVEAVQKAEPAFKEALKTVKDALHHPGMEYGLGLAGERFSRVPGTPAYGFRQLMEKINGENFLAGYQSLKGGGGNISNIEGEKTEKARAAVSQAQNPADFRARMNDLEIALRTDLETAQRRVNKPVTAWQRNPNDDYAPDLGQPGVRKGKAVEYLGGNPADDRSYGSPR